MNEPDAQLLHHLKLYVPGADVGTFNMARDCYENTPNPNVRAMLDPMIRKALVTHDWTPLRARMIRWPYVFTCGDGSDG